MPREERATSKDRWWRPLLGGRSRAELPGVGERGDKGSLRCMRGGERFYSQGGRRSQVFPYKEESAGYSGRWCPRAPCWYLLGPGCRGSVPGSLASLWNLSVAFFRGIPQHARPFTKSLSKNSTRHQSSTKKIAALLLFPFILFSYVYTYSYVKELWILSRRHWIIQTKKWDVNHYLFDFLGRTPFRDVTKKHILRQYSVNYKINLISDKKIRFRIKGK